MDGRRGLWAVTSAVGAVDGEQPTGLYAAGMASSHRGSGLQSSRRARLVEAARSSLWAWPSAAAASAFVLAVVLSGVRPERSSGLGQVLWPGGAASAMTMLQVIAASAVTVTGLTFSLTVVALQLASQQFSPRLLREFARDRVVQVVLAIFVATFVFTMTAVRGFQPDRPVPAVALAVGFVLGLASVAALLAFIGHIIRTLRVDTMMLTVHAETRRAMAAFYPAYGEEPPPNPPTEPDAAVTVSARASGFIRIVDAKIVVEAARQADAFIRLEVRPGDHVVRGAPLATAWRCSPLAGSGSALDGDGVTDRLAAGIQLGYERTSEQDVAFGFRRLVDIAVKALSPSINDPVTAAHATGHLADLLVGLTGCHLGPIVHNDGDGVPRALFPDRDLGYYLDLACGQVRRYGRHEPTVLKALLRMLRDVATAARDDGQRGQIRRQAGLILAEVPDTLISDDADAVHDLAQRVEQALQGDTRASYRDRSGETRSM
ncbi:MAG TPA: DUF2254 domain-containing protein [Cryptosporangiaceae bacterium]|nr:DUF2254 domain-containing protein [Cryptosporangiaceae bacterium]